MTLELIILGFVLVAICAGFVALFLRAFYCGTFTKALIFKGAASVCFVTLGLITYLNSNMSMTSLLIFIGLCCGIIGDEVIALCQVFPKHDSLAFIGGGSCFLVGHGFYIVSLLLLGNVSWITLIISFVLVVAMTAIYANYRKFLTGEMKIPLALYLGILIFTTALAIGVFAKRGTLGAGLFALGGALFTASDNLLFAYKFGYKPKFAQNIALHVTYYLAQLAIAWGIAWL